MGCGSSRARTADGSDAASDVASAPAAASDPAPAEAAEYTGPSEDDGGVPRALLDLRPGWVGALCAQGATTTAVKMRPPRIQLFTADDGTVDGATFGSVGVGTGTSHTAPASPTSSAPPSQEFSSPDLLVGAAARVVRVHGSLAYDPDGSQPVRVASLAFTSYVSGAHVRTADVGQPTPHTFELAAPPGQCFVRLQVGHVGGRDIGCLGGAEAAALDVL